MFKQLSPLRPKTNEFGIPAWYHMHGSEIRVKEVDLEKHVFVLASNSAEVMIRRHRSQGWELEYEIRQPDGSKTEGKIWMCTYDLKAAFRISDECYEIWGASVLQRHGGDVAHEGKYIRFEKYLNIPGPGTGDNGDPNVSICVDDYIKEAFDHFLVTVGEH